MKKKGFTLIELMIVISVIAILTAAVVPKLGFMKDNNKNDLVKSNVQAVKNFLLNRRSIDGNKIYNSAPGELSILLQGVKTDIGLSMENTFVDSRNLKNPFIGSSSIIYNYNDLNSEISGNADGSVVYDDTASVPKDENNVTYPSGYNYVSHKGSVIVILHKDGYEGYGLDKDGGKTDPFVIKFPDSGDFSLSNDIKPVMSQLDSNKAAVENYLRRRVKNDVAYATMTPGNDRKNLMDNLYWNDGKDAGGSGVPSAQVEYPSVEKIVNPFNNGSGLYLVTNTGNSKKIPAGTSILIFETDTYFSSKNYSAYKGMVCIIPYYNSGTGTLLGYKVYTVDQNGTVSLADVVT